MSNHEFSDCVKMTDELQAKMRERYAGLSDEEMIARIRERLETSDDTLARKWRSLKDFAAPDR